MWERRFQLQAAAVREYDEGKELNGRRADGDSDGRAGIYGGTGATSRASSLAIRDYRTEPQQSEEELKSHAGDDRRVL